MSDLEIRRLAAAIIEYLRWQKAQAAFREQQKVARRLKRRSADEVSDREAAA